ncbi:MAG: nuclease [Bacteroidia bacterium]
MSPDRLRAILAALRWSLRGLAGHLGHASDTRVVQWAMDRKPVPAEVAEWLERVAAWHLANQAPRKP